MRTIAGLACLFFAISSFGSIENRRFSGKGLTQLTVKNGSGDIDITVSKDGRVHVKADKTELDGECKVRMKQSGNEIRVETKSKGEACIVNYAIQVPKNIGVKLSAGTGDIDVKGTKGEVELTLGSGEADIEGEISSLDAKTGTGEIEVKGLMGGADIKTGTGDVEVTYLRPLINGDLKVKTGTGEVTLNMPSNAKISTRFQSGSGSLYNEIGDSEDAQFNVRVQSGSGDLKIKKLPN